MQINKKSIILKKGKKYIPKECNMALFLESKSLHIEVEESGKFKVYDKIVDMEWDMGDDFLFGVIHLKNGENVNIDRFELSSLPNSIILSHEDPEKDITFRANLRLILPGDKFDLIINVNKDAEVDYIEFLRNAFLVDKDFGGFYVIPLKSGRFLFPDNTGEKRGFFSSELSMFMYGIVNDSSLLLSIWDDPSLDFSISSKNGLLTSTFITNKHLQRVQFRIIPEGDVTNLARNYREYVMRKGYIVPWEERGKSREEIIKPLKSVVFDIKDMGEENFSTFLSHLKDDLKLSQFAFFFGDKKFEIVKEEMKKGECISLFSDSRLGIKPYILEIDSPLEKNDTRRQEALVVSRELKEKLLPFTDMFLGSYCNPKEPSSFPFFEMVYGDTIVIGENVEDFSDIDKELLGALLLGKLPILSEKFVPEGNYWEKEDDNTPPEWIRYMNLFERPSIFMLGEDGWGEGLHPFDVFLKNLYEIFIPFRRIVFGKKLLRYEFLDEKNLIIYVNFDDDIEGVVNLGSSHYEYFSVSHGRTFLPPYGFIFSSPSFLSFYAYGINDFKKDKPLLVSVRTLDEKDFKATQRLKVYHAFGPSEFKFMRKIIDVREEKIYSLKR